MDSRAFGAAPGAGLRRKNATRGVGDGRDFQRLSKKKKNNSKNNNNNKNNNNTNSEISHKSKVSIFNRNLVLTFTFLIHKTETKKRKERIWKLLNSYAEQ